MTARYVLLTEGATTEQKDAFTKALQGKPVGFWHWYSDSWIITDVSGGTFPTTASLRDAFHGFAPQATCVVVSGAEGWASWLAPDKSKWFTDKNW